MLNILFSAKPTNDSINIVLCNNQFYNRVMITHCAGKAV